ncbi:MAG: hypothetical protein RJA59_267 [Pseudomonadota bacterium]
MSRTTQEKFLDALEVIAATYKCEVVRDAEYSNTGSIRIEPEVGFDTIVSFKYSFQTGYASFRDCRPGFGNPKVEGGHNLYHVTPDQMQGVLVRIATILGSRR